VLHGALLLGQPPRPTGGGRPLATANSGRGRWKPSLCPVRSASQRPFTARISPPRPAHRRVPVVVAPPHGIGEGASIPRVVRQPSVARSDAGDEGLCVAGAAAQATLVGLGSNDGSMGGSGVTAGAEAAAGRE
jgi:hypothetical protein